MYEVDIYTYNGAIIPNECHTLEDVFNVIRSSIDIVQLINITKL